MDKFWLVWCESKAGESRPRGDAPTFKHESEESARTEAERLAHKFRGQQFHVVELVGSVKHKNMEWTEPTKPESEKVEMVRKELVEEEVTSDTANETVSGNFFIASRSTPELVSTFKLFGCDCAECRRRR